MPIHIDGLYTREIPTVKYNEKTKEFEELANISLARTFYALGQYGLAG
jgi:hypothetical protein